MLRSLVGSEMCIRDRLLIYIKKICDLENGNISDEALKLIVKISEGSVRDSLSLLDRALIFQSLDKTKNIEDFDVRKMLGLADKSKIFVENLGKEVVEKVSNVNISDNQRLQNFKKLYLSTFDNYYISRFVLGRYWRTIDKNIQKQFVKSFNKYIVATYAPKFKGWEGTFKATDSLFENNYYNVKMDIENKDGPTLKMMWKMYLNKNKEWDLNFFNNN